VTSTFTRERWALGWTRIALLFVGLPTALTYQQNAGPGGFVIHPERRAAATLRADLRSEGVAVEGPARAGPEGPGRHVLARVLSGHLLDILRRQNENSLNLDAEVLTKMLGAVSYGPPGSIAKGARAVEAWARREGVAVSAHDGSGLSYLDRITTDGMVRLLALAGSDPWGRALRRTLPAAGEGTLAGRLAGLRVRAKTGTLLRRVSALSGWVWLTRARLWAEFSVLSRGLQKSRAVALEDAIVRTLASRA
jgi:PBP4 family serine-type D-alanyl-D-alanine carboxypeptidase